jgi:hypothetical protein
MSEWFPKYRNRYFLKTTPAHPYHRVCTHAHVRTTRLTSTVSCTLCTSTFFLILQYCVCRKTDRTRVSLMWHQSIRSPIVLNSCAAHLLTGLSIYQSTSFFNHVWTDFFPVDSADSLTVQQIHWWNKKNPLQFHQNQLTLCALTTLIRTTMTFIWEKEWKTSEKWWCARALFLPFFQAFSLPSPTILRECCCISQLETIA